MAQTSDGYLWLGTEFGLVRFDGIQFIPSGAGVGPSLPSTIIWSLMAARDGTLWVGTLDGLFSWHAGQLINYPEFAAKPVFALLEDHDGAVWAGGTAGLCAIRGKSVECSAIDGPLSQGLYYSNQSRGGIVYSLYEDGERHLWVGTESGLWKWVPGPPRRYTSQILRAQQGLVAGDGGKGLVAISGAADRILLQTARNGMEAYTIPGVPQLFGAESLLRDREGALWIGTMQRGLMRVHDGSFSWPEEKSRLSGDFISSLLEDREGIIWAGTTNGLDRFRKAAVSTISANEGLSTPVGCVLAARDGSLWMGSYGGLNRLHGKQLTIYRATAPPVRPSGSVDKLQAASGLGEVTQVTDPELLGNAIDSLFEDPRGRIWVGTDHGTAWFENGRFHRVKGVPDTIWIAMFADAREGVWISYPGSGLFHVVEGNVVESVPWPWSASEPDPRLSAVVSDPRSGGLWLGFLHGGVAYFKDGQLQTALSGQETPGSDTVWNLHIDHEGTLWAATEGGLRRIKDGRVTTLTSKNGLPCDSVKWVIEDDAFSLWLNTACGLVRVERNELNAWATDSQDSIHPLVLDRTDGLRMHALGVAFSPVVTKSTDGKLWFVHLDGVSAIDPLHLPTNRVPPPVYIERITAGDRTYPATAGLRLPAELRDLTIDYTALSLVAPEKVRFRFKLEGQDPDWRETVNNRRVEYSNLAPGNYRFRVIAANNSGVWNEEGATLDFSVAPAYWQTNWFRALCVLAFIASLWGLYLLRLRQLKRHFNTIATERRRAEGERMKLEERLHQAEKMEAIGRFASGIAHDFNNVIGGIMAYGEMLFEEAPEDAPRKRYAQNVLTAANRGHELVEQILAYSRSQHGEHVPIDACRIVAETLELFRASVPASVTLKTSIPDAPLVVMGHATQLYQVVTNLCRNAIQAMSAGGTLQVAITPAEVVAERPLAQGKLSPGRFVCLSVEDSGSGIDEVALARIFEPFFTTKEAGRGTGLGLALVWAIVTDLGGAIDVKSRLGEGSTFSIYIPLAYAEGVASAA